MSRKFLFPLLFLLGSFPNKLLAQDLSAQSSSAQTTWEGKLGNIRIILHLSEDALSRQMTAEYDSPDQGAFGLKVSELKIKGDSLSAYSSVIGGGFAGTFNTGKTELSGKWKQGGGELPLVLKITANKEVFKRPQTPKAPFPYQEQKVIYYNKDKSIQYGATLTLPRSDKEVPAVILITGSGQQDRDETLFGHKPFWVIADHLSRNGIAVMRVDDRGIGESTGDVMNATSLDFAQDVLVGIDYLKTHKGVDIKKIGLIGHSEGGVIAPLVAVQTKDVAFIISLAGVGVKGADLLKKQFRHSYSNLNLSKEELNRLDSLTQMMIQLSDKYTEDELKSAFAQSMEDWLERQPDTFLVKVGLKGPNADSYINEMASRFFLPWMRYFIKYDPSTTLTKITIPVLALNGGKDTQVDAKENLAGFDKLLTQAGNKNIKTVLFPNLNHLFQNAETGGLDEYAAIKETISPEVLTTITQWIHTLYDL